MINITAMDNGTVERANTVLAGFPGGAKKALGSALKRAAVTGQTYAARAAAKHYYIKVSDFKDHTKTARRIKTTFEGTEIAISFRGKRIPLIKFKVQVSANGKVKANVKRENTGAQLNRVFVATMRSGHYGIFERVGTKRLPIDEKFSVATPQMLGSEAAEKDMEEQISESFNKNLDAQIFAIINGWRR